MSAEPPPAQPCGIHTPPLSRRNTARGQGAAPAYVSTLTDEIRSRLRDAVRERLPIEPDGTIPLTARAWAVRGNSR